MTRYRSEDGSKDISAHESFREPTTGRVRPAGWLAHPSTTLDDVTAAGLVPYEPEIEAVQVAPEDEMQRRIEALEATKIALEARIAGLETSLADEKAADQ